MGEVYRARDTNLLRDVAIKTLPTRFGTDPDCLARSRREAQLLASLNHSNIAHVYGVEDVAGMPALVMELVEGPTLAERIAKGSIPLDEALPIAKQIAEALEAAHERWIIHRDLKPANIKVRADGTVKVLDFGLGKLSEPAVVAGTATMTESPTITTPAMTAAGMILGTAAYMSPEQARGLPVDQRADIWAFGCILFEMLTGRQAFGGPTTTDSLAAVIHKSPMWEALPLDTPGGVRRALTRCLEKSVNRRLRDIADVRADLDDVVGPAPHSGELPMARRKSRALITVVVAAALAAGVFFLGSWWRARQPATTAWIAERLGGSTVAFAPHLSPDGQTVAFAALIDGQTQLAVLKPQSGTWTALTHGVSRGSVGRFSWSTDGSRLFFDRFFEVPLGIYSISALGGEERPVLDNAMAPEVLPDGSLLVVRINAARQPQLYRVWLDTGRSEPLPALLASSHVSVSLPVRASPDGRGVVFYGRSADTSQTADAYQVLDLRSKSIRRVANFEDSWFPNMAMTRDGKSVLFERSAGDAVQLVTVRLDESAPIHPVLTLLSRSYFFDVGSDGSLYLDQIAQPLELISWTPADSLVTRQALPDNYERAMPLPDGRTLAQAGHANRVQLVLVTSNAPPEALVETTEATQFPAAPLGPKALAFIIGERPRRQVAIASADGHIQRRLAHVDGNEVSALAGSPDGLTLFFAKSGFVWSIPADESAAPKKIHEGDSMAVDPHGDFLIVKVEGGDQIRLVRVSLTDGREERVPIEGDAKMPPDPLSPQAIATDGRIAIRVGWKDSWFYPAAVLDPRTGSVTPMPKSLNLDVNSPSWTPEGRVISMAFPTYSSLWRFHSRTDNAR